MISFFRAFGGRPPMAFQGKKARVEITRATGEKVYSLDFRDPIKAMTLFNELRPERESKMLIYQLTIFDIVDSGLLHIKAQVQLTRLPENIDVLFRVCRNQ